MFKGGRQTIPEGREGLTLSGLPPPNRLRRSHETWTLQLKSCYPCRRGFVQESMLKERGAQVAVVAEISVIVPVHEMSRDFSRCLAAIGRLSPPPREVIVVVDGGSAAAMDTARAAGVAVKQTPTCLGPAAARNLGAQEAEGEILFFVDADVVVGEDAILRLRTIFDAPDAPDAVIGVYDDTPPASNFLSQYKNLLQHFVHVTADEQLPTFWGACGAVRKAAFLSVGGFDERYDKPSIEDIELGYRLRDNGFTIRISKALQVTHLKRWSPKKLFVSDFFRRALPWSRLILSAGRMDDVLNIRKTERLKVALTYFLLMQLVSTPLYPLCGLSAAATAVLLCVADTKLLRFYYRKRGLVFAGRALLWHWFYYIYSGFAFGLTMLAHGFGRVPSRTKKGWPPGWNRVL